MKCTGIELVPNKQHILIDEIPRFRLLEQAVLKIFCLRQSELF